MRRASRELFSVRHVAHASDDHAAADCEFAEGVRAMHVAAAWRVESCRIGDAMRRVRRLVRDTDRKLLGWTCISLVARPSAASWVETLPRLPVKKGGKVQNFLQQSTKI